VSTECECVILSYIILSSIYLRVIPLTRALSLTFYEVKREGLVRWMDGSGNKYKVKRQAGKTKREIIIRGLSTFGLGRY
jgi:hypothetical protein